MECAVGVATERHLTAMQYVLQQTAAHHIRNRRLSTVTTDRASA